MANNQNLFFYAPTWDYPTDGPIKLGNVITSVKKPERPLHCAPPTDSNVFSTKKTNVKHTKDEAQNEKFSILVKFFNILGLDVQVSVGRQTSDQRTFSFKIIETKQFVPTLPYIQACVENDNVRRFLEMSRYPQRHKLGLSKLMDSSENGAAAKTVTEWESSDNFVFAFRARKVLVGKATGQVISEEDYRRGAMFGDNAELREIHGPPLSILKVEHPDAEAEGCYTEELTEGEDVVTCALQRHSDSED